MRHLTNTEEVQHQIRKFASLSWDFKNVMFNTDDNGNATNYAVIKTNWIFNFIFNFLHDTVEKNADPYISI